MATPTFNDNISPDDNVRALIQEQATSGSTAARPNGLQPFPVLIAKAAFNAEQKAQQAIGGVSPAQAAAFEPKTEYKDASFTAVVGRSYNVNEVGTPVVVTSPSGTEGASFNVFVQGGTVNVGGVNYTDGQTIKAHYVGGGWEYNLISAESAVGTALVTAASASDARDAIGAASSLQGSTIYLDATNGNDSTGVRGTAKPFLTLAAAITASQAGDTLVIRAGTYISGKVTLKTGVTLQGSGRDSTILRLATGANDYLLVNADPTGGNPNITIRDLTLDGNRSGQTLGVIPAYAGPVFFKNVDYIRVENVKIKDPYKFGFHVCNTDYPTFRDIYFDLAAPVISNDGIHINGPSIGGVIENVYGTLGDDMVALNAVDGEPYMTNLWGYGEISNWTIRNIQGNGFRAVRLLAGTLTGTRYDVRNIDIDGVTGTYSFPAISLTELGSEANYKNIKITGINAYSSTGSCVVVEDDTVVDSIELRFNVRSTLPEALFQVYGYVKSAVIGGTYEDLSSSIGGAFVYTGAAGARIDQLVLDCPVFRAATVSGQAGVYANFGTIGSVSVIGADFYNVRSPVLLSNAANGTTDNVTVIGGVFDYAAANTNGVVTIAGATAHSSNVGLIGVRANNTYLIKTDISTALTGCVIRESGSIITNAPSGNDFSIIGGVSYRVITDTAKVNLTLLTPVVGDSAVSDGSGGYTASGRYAYNGTTWNLIGRAIAQADVAGLTSTSNVTFGNILAAITGASVITGQGTTEANFILKDTGFTSGLQTFGLNWNGGVLTFRRMNDAANSVTSTPMILDIATGNLRLTGSLGVGNTAAATTPGTVTRKMEVFDASGSSLGFMPIYNAIT